MPTKGLIANEAAQKGWNCFDIAAGLERKHLVNEALTDNPERRAHFCALLAPEIRNAAYITYLHLKKTEGQESDIPRAQSYREQIARLLKLTQGMDKTEQEEVITGQLDYLDLTQSVKITTAPLKKHPKVTHKKIRKNAGWPRYALPECMATIELKETVQSLLDAQLMLDTVRRQIDEMPTGEEKNTAMLQVNTVHLPNLNAAETAFKKFSARDDIYTAYIKKYYGQQGWFAFQPTQDQTSMIDIAAEVYNCNFTIYQNQNFINPTYHTNLAGEVPNLAIYYNGTNHFMAYDPDHTNTLKKEEANLDKLIRSNDTAKLIKLLLRLRDMDARESQYGANAMHWAAYRGDIAAIPLLYQVGVPINSKDSNKARTPLGFVCRRYSQVSGDLKNKLAACARQLIEFGADVAIADKDNKSPADYAPSLCSKTTPRRISGSYKKRRTSRAESPFKLRGGTKSYTSLDIQFKHADSNVIIPGNTIHKTLQRVEHAFRAQAQKLRKQYQLTQEIRHLEQQTKANRQVETLSEADIEKFLASIFDRNHSNKNKKILTVFQAKCRKIINKAAPAITAKNLTPTGTKNKRLPSKRKTAKALHQAAPDWLNILAQINALTPPTSSIKKDLKVILPQLEATLTPIKTLQKRKVKLERRLTDSGAMPAEAPSEDSTNFVVAAISFTVVLGGGTIDTITCPIVLNNSTIFTVYNTRRDTYIAPTHNAVGSLSTLDPTFEAMIAKTNPDRAGDKQANNHSEQAIFYHIYDERTHYALIKRLRHQAPDMTALLAITLDMHSTRAMCSNCQKAAKAFLADKMKFRHSLLRVLTQQKPSLTTDKKLPQLFCRVSADEPHKDCPKVPTFLETVGPVDSNSLKNDSLKADTHLLRQLNTNKDVHRYSIATSGGAHDPRIYQLAYASLVQPTLNEASKKIATWAMWHAIPSLLRKHIDTQLAKLNANTPVTLFAAKATTQATAATTPPAQPMSPVAG